MLQNSKIEVVCHNPDVYDLATVVSLVVSSTQQPSAHNNIDHLSRSKSS